MNGLLKKSLLLSLSFLTASALFATGAQDSAAADDGPVTLSLLIDNQSPTEGIDAVIAAAEEELGIKMEIELRPGGAEGDNLLKTRLMADEMTDFSYYNTGSLFMALNPQQYFVDLTDEPFNSRVVDSFKPTVSVDGRVYAAPAGSSMAGGWFYNKKVYAQLGLDVPKTWDELMANCEAIEAAGIQSLLASYKDSWTAQLLVLGDYYNVDALSPGFADDYTANKDKFASNAAALRGFEKLHEVGQRGLIGSEPLATGYEDALNMLLTGEGAHYPMLAFALPSWGELDPEKVNDIGFFPQPGDSADRNGITLWMPGGIALSNSSKNVDKAKEFLDFFISPEGSLIHMGAESPSGAFMVKGVEMPDDVYEAVKDMIPYLDRNATAAALEFLSPIKGPNLPQICVEVGVGITSPVEAAAKYDKDVEKQAKQLGLAGW